MTNRALGIVSIFSIINLRWVSEEKTQENMNITNLNSLRESSWLKKPAEKNQSFIKGFDGDTSVMNLVKLFLIKDATYMVIIIPLCHKVTSYDVYLCMNLLIVIQR